MTLHCSGNSRSDASSCIAVRYFQGCMRDYVETRKFRVSTWCWICDENYVKNELVTFIHKHIHETQEYQTHMTGYMFKSNLSSFKVLKIMKVCKYICTIFLSFFLSFFLWYQSFLSLLQKKIIIFPMIILNIVDKKNAFSNLSFWFQSRIGKFYYPDNIVRHVGKCPQQDFANSSPSSFHQFEIQKCQKHLSREFKITFSSQ